MQANQKRMSVFTLTNAVHSFLDNILNLEFEFSFFVVLRSYSKASFLPTSMLEALKISPYTRKV